MLYRFYAPVVALQLFCIYHAYKSNAEQRWYWLILFLPFFGSVIYLYITFFNSKNIRTLEEGVKEIVIDNYRIGQLEKERAFSDSHTTRIRLADEYSKNGRYADALNLYRESLTGFMSDDPGLRMKILRAHFLNKDFAEATEIGLELESDKTFKNSEERVAYAWALHYSGNSNKANAVFEDMDKSFTNYRQRTEYCKFLVETSQAVRAKEKLAEVLEEANHMRDTERKMTRHVIREAKEMYASLAKA
jgi:hypothetical protein